MLLSLLTSAAFAQEPVSAIPRHRLYYESLAALRYNPLGLQERFTVGYRLRLFDKPADDLLLSDSYIWVGATGLQTPAFMRAGPWVRVMPLALLRFQAGYELVQYHGGFDQMLVWGAREVTDYSPDGMEALAAQGTTRAKGSILTLETRVQAKAGPVAVRATVGRYQFRYDVDGVAFYDQTLDILAPTDGAVWSTDVDLLYVASDKLTAGVRSTHTRSGAEMVDNANLASTRQASIDRTGPLVAYQFKADVGSRFAKPTLYTICQWHIDHEYRTGQEVSRAIPYFAVGFAFTGDGVAWEP